MLNIFLVFNAIQITFKIYFYFVLFLVHLQIILTELHLDIQKINDLVNFINKIICLCTVKQYTSVIINNTKI